MTCPKCLHTKDWPCPRYGWDCGNIENEGASRTDAKQNGGGGLRDIFDTTKRKWYRIQRGWFGRLKLTEIIYEQVIRAPTPSDLVFDD